MCNEKNHKNANYKNRILSALDQSESILPEVVQINNLSKNFHLQKLLGTKRKIRLVKRNRSGKCFKASVYDIQKEIHKKEGDTLHQVILKNLGEFSTKKQACSACDKACIQRDALLKCRKYDTEHLETHFHLLIVSQKFLNLTHHERLWLVYDVLLNEFVEENVSIPKLKGFHFIGPLVRSLPHVKHLLSNFPFELMLELRTPSQYQSSQNISETNNNVDTKKRNTLPALENPLYCDSKRSLSHFKNLLQASRPTMKKGIHGHFFHDLKSKSKNIFLDEYEKNKSLVRGHESALEHILCNGNLVRSGQSQILHDVSELPRKEKIRTRSKISCSAKALDQKERNLSAKSNFNTSNLHNESVFIFQNLTKKFTLYAISLQRIFRIEYYHRVQQLWLKTQIAALCIQRFIKGCQTRELVKLHRLVLESSTIILQSRWRARKGNREAKMKRKLLTKFVLSLQPRIRGWILRSRIRWEKEHNEISIILQCIFRGYLARIFVRNLEIERCHSLQQKSAVLIQSFTRRKFARTYFEQLLLALKQKRAAILIQSVWRCYQGWVTSMKLKREKSASTCIQKVFRGYIQTNWFKRYKHESYKSECASKIQFAARRYILRQLIEIKKKQRYTAEVIIPASILIQACYRGFTCRRDSMKNRLLWIFAKKIQKVYAKTKSKQKAIDERKKLQKQRHNYTVIKIQSAYRGWRCRKRAENLRSENIAGRIFASKIISRAWCRHRDLFRQKSLKKEVERSKNDAKFANLNNEVISITNDLNDIKQDLCLCEKRITWLKKRIREIHSFRSEAFNRMTKIEEESSDLETIKENEKLQRLIKSEKDQLNQQIELGIVELKSCKAQIKISLMKKERLHDEYDELHIILGDIYSEMEMHFSMCHKIEIQECISKRDNDLQQRICKEKVHWKVKNNEKHPHALEERASLIHSTSKNIFHGPQTKGISKHDVSNTRNKFISPDDVLHFSEDKFNYVINQSLSVIKKSLTMDD